jgi:transcription factor C subunit 6
MTVFVPFDWVLHRVLTMHQIADLPAQGHPRKLGVLAGTFEDGSLSIYAIPEPQDMLPNDYTSSSGPVFGSFQMNYTFYSFNRRILTYNGLPVHLSDPVVRVEMTDAMCWSLDWGNSDILAVGCTNGRYTCAVPRRLQC